MNNEISGKENHSSGGLRDSVLPRVSVSFFFLFLSLLVIYPILSRFNSAYIGAGELEGWLWRYWWMKKLIFSALSCRPAQPGAVLYTIFTAGNYPETGNVLDLLLISLPLEQIFGPPVYYNTKVILILFLNGMAGYTMCLNFFKNRWISAAGGAVLILNPYVLGEIASGRIRHAILFAMPLYVLHLFRAYREKSWGAAVWAGVWLGLTAAFYLYYGLALLFFSLIFLLYQLIFDRRNSHHSFFLKLTVIVVIFLAITAPFCIRYLETAIQGKELPEVSWGKSVPSLAFLQGKEDLPRGDGGLNMSLRRLLRDSPGFMYPVGIDGKIYIPLIITLLVLPPLIFVRPVPWLWMINLAFFYMLSLGPFLKLGDGVESAVIIGGNPIALPYTLFFKYIPFFSRLFSPIRWMGFLCVILAVLLAGNLKWMGGWISGQWNEAKACRATGVISVLIPLLALAQMFWMGNIPLPVNPVKVPAFYGEIAQDSMLNGLVELPYPPSDSRVFFQAFHGKKILGGWKSTPPGIPQDSPAGKLSVIDHTKAKNMVDYLEGLNRFDGEAGEFPSGDLEKLEEMGYEYIVLHERGCGEMFPEKSPEFFDYIVEKLSLRLGSPVIVREEWIELPPRTWKAIEKSGRMAIFKIPEGEDSK